MKSGTREELHAWRARLIAKHEARPLIKMFREMDNEKRKRDGRPVLKVSNN
jgi:hypothetical protein